MLTFRNTGFKAVSFDPPFEPPYTITKITFPSVTTNGVPAVFPSVRLCELNATTGRIDPAAPLFQVAPFLGKADGDNEVSIDLTVTEPGKVFFWCVEFPSSAISSFPDDFPFLRTDLKDMERGLFASSFDILSLSSGGAVPILHLDRNIIASMSCRVSSASAIPLDAPRNLGANLRGPSLWDGRVEFSFAPARNAHADGPGTVARLLDRTELLYFGPLGQWTVVASTDQASDKTISIPSGSYYGFRVWATRSVERNGLCSLPSCIVWAPPVFDENWYGSYEPNGSIEEATQISPSTSQDFGGSCFPAGDRDFYSFDATPGDLIDARAGTYGSQGGDGINDLDLVLFLYDSKGRVVASDDNSAGFLWPRITYRVPSMPGGGMTPRLEKFTLEIRDINGSKFRPEAAPRVLFRDMEYIYSVYVPPARSEPARLNAASGNVLVVRILGCRNTGQGVAVDYSLPQETGSHNAILKIFDVHGRHVRTLVGDEGTSGPRTMWWDGTDKAGRRVSAGTYYSRLEIGNARATFKIAILK